MEKIFNIAGPCLAQEHYMLPAEDRIVDIHDLIRQKQYFVVHAARQSGKTTLLQGLVKQINERGDYYALYCSLEAVQGITDPLVGMPEVANLIAFALEFSNIPVKSDLTAQAAIRGVSVLLRSVLTTLCKEADKPVVVFFDEADCLSGQTLVSFLRQLRDGFINRGQIPFVHAVALVGMHNIRDYKAMVREGSKTLGSASPFNVVSESLTLTNFTFEQVRVLYLQHEQATGQIFQAEALERAFYHSSGQPWLVNALAREVVSKLLQYDYSKPITGELIDQAAKNIILRRDTHLDSLLERLKEERVRRVIEPLLLGKAARNMLSDDMQFCLDLGIITASKGEVYPSNPIYREVIVRTLSYDTEFDLINRVQNVWIKDGQADMDGLLRAFQEFWRENSEIWIERYQYKEAAPHLIIQAFLQRLINGGGALLREYASGRGRVDLCAVLGSNRYPIELKINYGKKTREDGLRQLAAYMDTFGVRDGWLLIFDRDSEKSWADKLWWDMEELEGKKIRVIGC